MNYIWFLCHLDDFFLNLFGYCKTVFIFIKHSWAAICSTETYYSLWGWWGLTIEQLTKWKTVFLANKWATIINSIVLCVITNDPIKFKVRLKIIKFLINSVSPISDMIPVATFSEISSHLLENLALKRRKVLTRFFLFTFIWIVCDFQRIRGCPNGFTMFWTISV